MKNLTTNEINKIAGGSFREWFIGCDCDVYLRLKENGPSLPVPPNATSVDEKKIWFLKGSDVTKCFIKCCPSNQNLNAYYREYSTNSIVGGSYNTFC